MPRAKKVGNTRHPRRSTTGPVLKEFSKQLREQQQTPFGLLTQLLRLIPPEELTTLAWVLKNRPRALAGIAYGYINAAMVKALKQPKIRAEIRETVERLFPEIAKEAEKRALAASLVIQRSVKNANSRAVTRPVRRIQKEG